MVFTYIIVLPAAVKFLQGYNSSQFDNLVQAKPLYSFEVVTMGAIGLAFQLPLMLLGLRQLGVINGSTLTRHWRYATVIIAVIAAAMPGPIRSRPGWRPPRSSSSSSPASCCSSSPTAVTPSAPPPS